MIESEDRLRSLLAAGDLPSEDSVFVAGVMQRVAAAPLRIGVSGRRPMLPALLRPLVWVAPLAAIGAVLPSLAQGLDAVLAGADAGVVGGSLSLVAGAWAVLDALRRGRRSPFGT